VPDAGAREAPSLRVCARALATLALLMLVGSAYGQGGKPTGSVTPAPPPQQVAGAAQKTAWHMDVAKQIQ
jgi:hypothetical protein